MNAFKWVKIWLLLGCLIPLTGIFNYIIDPYGFNKKILIHNINVVKEDNTPFTIKYKAPKVRAGGWDNLMLGTSRIGLMDSKIVDNYLGGKTFTLSQPGSAMPIQFDSFRYAVQFNQIKNLIYGIDFMTFNKNLKLNVDYIQYKDELQSFGHFYTHDIYINFTTLKKSLRTLQNNLSEQPKLNPFYAENGMRNFPNFKQQLANETLDMTVNINKHIQKYFKKDGIYANYEYSPEYMAMFKKIVTYCHKNDINLYVYISPVYAEHFYAIKAAGLKPEFERFKRELIKVTDFIDFTGISSVTVNKDNFWDSSHLRKVHTDMIMARLFENDNALSPPDFGIKVTKENIEQHLQKQDSQYQQINLEEILAINYEQ